MPRPFLLGQAWDMNTGMVLLMQPFIKVLVVSQVHHYLNSQSVRLPTC